MTRACFHIMVPAMVSGSPGHTVVATFNVTDEADLLRELEARRPGMRADQALVAVNEAALGMLLRASVDGRKR